MRGGGGSPNLNQMPWRRGQVKDVGPWEMGDGGAHGREQWDGGGVHLSHARPHHLGTSREPLDRGAGAQEGDWGGGGGERDQDSDLVSSICMTMQMALEQVPVTLRSPHGRLGDTGCSERRSEGMKK